MCQGTIKYRVIYPLNFPPVLQPRAKSVCGSFICHLLIGGSSIGKKSGITSQRTKAGYFDFPSRSFTLQMKNDWHSEVTLIQQWQLLSRMSASSSFAIPQWHFIPALFWSTADLKWFGTYLYMPVLSHWDVTSHHYLQLCYINTCQYAA